MGTGRAARSCRRARHQLHLARRRAGALPSRRRAAGAAVEHGRRLRRRRDVPRLRRRVRPPRGVAQRRRAGGRRGDGRRSGGADDDVLGVPLRHRLFDEHAPGTNLLDTGAHFYDVYECSDGKYISIGSIEPQFYAELLRLTGLAGDPQFEVQNDKTQWPRLKERIAELFKTRTRDEWCELMEGSEVCFAPVLTMSEAAEHPHNVARATFVERSGRMQPAPAPRFSRTEPGARPPAGARRAAHARGAGRLGRRRRTDRRAHRVRRGQAGAEWARSSASTPIPTTRRSSTGGSMARAHAEGHRVVLVVATNGEHGEVPDDLAPGETLVDRRRAETAQSAAALGIDRVVWLGYRRLGDDRLGAERRSRELPAAPTSTRPAARLADDPARRGRRRAHDLRLARQLRPPRSHQGPHGRRPGRARSWPTTSPASGSSRRRSTATRSRR